MAKVHYVQGRYRDAQGMCARVGLEELTHDDQPIYHLRLLAEAFIIKGTGCLSKPNGKVRFHKQHIFIALAVIILEMITLYSS